MNDRCADQVDAVATLMIAHTVLRRVVNNLHAVANRLLDDHQAELVNALAAALQEAAMTLITEKRPAGFTKGRRVKVAATCAAAAHTPALDVGTIGVVDRVFRNAYGWWVAVAFTAKFYDPTRGLYFHPPAADPVVVHYKPAELRRLPTRVKRK